MKKRVVTEMVVAVVGRLVGRGRTLDIYTLGQVPTLAISAIITSKTKPAGQPNGPFGQLANRPNPPVMRRPKVKGTTQGHN